MGFSLSKPSLSPHVQDSIVICDGLPPLNKPRYASTGDGRFVFVLGNERVSSVNSNPHALLEAYFDDDGICTTFDLDIIDLFLSKRSRLGNIGDVYCAGRPAGFYALDEQTVVILDLPGTSRTLCQRVVRIDREAKTAQYIFHRSYAIPSALDTNEALTFVESGFAVVVPQREIPQRSGFIIPADPLSKTGLKDISSLFVQANAHLARFYRAGSGLYKASLFSFNGTELGCLVDDPHDNGNFDQTHMLVIDTNTGEMRVREFPSEMFRLPANARKSECMWTANGHEVAVVSSFRLIGSCWQTTVADFIVRLIQKIDDAGDWMPTRVSDYCSGTIVDWMISVRLWLLLPRHLNRFGILNVQTMTWTKLEIDFDFSINEFDYSFNDMKSLSGGRFLIASLAQEVGPSRTIGAAPQEGDMERIELIRHPIRPSSLKQLATICVQRSARVDAAELELVADRCQE